MVQNLTIQIMLRKRKPRMIKLRQRQIVQRKTKKPLMISTVKISLKALYQSLYRQMPKQKKPRLLECLKPIIENEEIQLNDRKSLFQIQLSLMGRVEVVVQLRMQNNSKLCQKHQLTTLDQLHSSKTLFSLMNNTSLNR